jgi:hypothetical protein
LRWQGDVVVNVHDKEHFVAQNELYDHHVNYDDNLTWEQNVSNYNKQLSLEYITGYLIELSLSIDNVFVMIMIFMSFGVEKQYYHRVLFYGILGAIVLRFIFIFAAGALIQKFHWLLLVFGAFLIYSGIKMFIDRNKSESIDVENHPVVKFLAKRNLSTSAFDGHNFFTKVDGRWLCTPLFVVLMIIEFSDIIFAFDSISGYFLGDGGSAHRFLLQHLRYPRPAVDVLHVGEHHGQVRLSAHRFVGAADVHWCEDVPAVFRYGGRYRPFPCGHPLHLDTQCVVVGVVPAEESEECRII